MRKIFGGTQAVSSSPAMTVDAAASSSSPKKGVGRRVSGAFSGLKKMVIGKSTPKTDASSGAQGQAQQESRKTRFQAGLVKLQAMHDEANGPASGPEKKHSLANLMRQDSPATQLASSYADPEDTSRRRMIREGKQLATEPVPSTSGGEWTDAALGHAGAQANESAEPFLRVAESGIPAEAARPLHEQVQDAESLLHSSAHSGDLSHTSSDRRDHAGLSPAELLEDAQAVLDEMPAGTSGRHDEAGAEEAAETAAMLADMEAVLSEEQPTLESAASLHVTHSEPRTQTQPVSEIGSGTSSRRLRSAMTMPSERLNHELLQTMLTPTGLPKVESGGLQRSRSAPQIGEGAVARKATERPRINIDPGFQRPAAGKAATAFRDGGRVFGVDKQGFGNINALNKRPEDSALAVQNVVAPTKFLQESNPFHEALGLFTSAHTAINAGTKYRRYDRALQGLLAKDVAEFKQQVAQAKADPQTHKPPELKTLMLTRNGKGEFRYDVNKLFQLAHSGDERVKFKARNILLTMSIRDDQGRKRAGENTYKTLMAALGTGSAVALTVGLHGLGGALGPMKSAAGGAARAAAYSLGGMRELDFRKPVQETKDLMRTEKFERIGDIFTRNFQKLSSVPINERNPKPTYIENFIAAQGANPHAIPSDLEQGAYEGVLAAMLDHAEHVVDDQVFCGCLPFKMVNSTRAPEWKGVLMPSIATEHAVVVLESYLEKYTSGSVGQPRTGEQIAKLNTLFNAVSDPTKSRMQNLRELKKLVKADPHLNEAHALMMDMGMRKGEALNVIRESVRRMLNEHKHHELGITPDLELHRLSQQRVLPVQPNSTTGFQGSTVGGALSRR